MSLNSLVKICILVIAVIFVVITFGVTEGRRDLFEYTFRDPSDKYRGFAPYHNGFERQLNGPYMPVETSEMQTNVYSTIHSLPHGTTPIADQGDTLKRRGYIEVPYELNKI
jgi:hypothetical protein